MATIVRILCIFAELLSRIRTHYSAHYLDRIEYK